MNNRIFNVNGEGAAMLETAIGLACRQEGMSKPAEIVAWTVLPDCGLVWLWTRHKDSHPLLVPITPKQAAEMSIAWLNSEEARATPCDGWDRDYNDGDVSTEYGWRVYVDDWGHVGKSDVGHYAICAVRPAYMWFGK